MGSMRNLILLFVISLLAFPASRAQDDAMDTVSDEETTQEFKVEEPAKPVYVAPKASGNTFFTEAFESEESFLNRWILSKATKDDVDESKYDGKWSIEEPQVNPLDGDLGLVLKSKAKHHAVTAKLDKPFVFKGKPFIMQYEVKFQNGQDCGGAYVKLLSKDASSNLSQFMDKTPYVIMFGPDKCGTDSKLHFIFRHKHPIRETFEEKHAKKPTGAIKDMFTDKKTHLYTLVVYPDNLFEIYVDQDMVNSGSLLTDVQPPVNPPKEITDPDDTKPEDWDEKEKIPDPGAVKPDDWDETEPEFIPDSTAVQPEDWMEDELELVPDPDAEKPEDWDEDMDGEWEPPMISNPKCESVSGCGDWSPPQIKNPKYKGKWKAPMIDNPNYKGKWKARTIENPDYFEDKEPFKMTSIGAVGLELWSISNDILFDNFIITDDKGVADRWAADSWEVKHTQEIAGSSSGRSVVQAVMDATNERPWLWAVFILVVVLPIVLVIAYCCVGGSDKGWLRYLWNHTMQNKWLFGSFAGAAVFPLIYLCVRLFSKKEDKTAQHKKTDDPTVDDESDDDVEKKEEGEEGAKEEGEEEAKEGEERGAGDADTKKPASTPNTPKKKPSKDDLETDEAAEADAEDEEKEADSPAATRTSPRRRKTRKE